MMNTRIENAVKKLAGIFTNAFAAASAGIAVSPIPFSDIVILIPLQIILVNIIGYLSGSDINAESAKEFWIGMGGVGALGYGLRTLVQQGSKIINLTAPGAGSAISSTVAYSGTYAVGKTAQGYYIENQTKEELEATKKRAFKEGKYKKND